MPTSRVTWLSYEQMMYVKYGVENVCMVMDVYEQPLATTNIHFRNSKGQFVLKYLVVMSPCNDVLHLSCWPGSISNQILLEQSSFGKKLMDPSNPLNLPKNLLFRNGAGYSSVYCLADQEWSSTFPFLLVCPRLQAMNIARLSVERFFGQFTAMFRFCLWYCLHIENMQNLIYAAVGLWNFRLKNLGDDDPSHIHSVVCVHNVGLFFDARRDLGDAFANPCPVRSRNNIIVHHNGIPLYMPAYAEPGQADGIVPEEQLNDVHMHEHRLVDAQGRPILDPEFEEMARERELPFFEFN